MNKFRKFRALLVFVTIFSVSSVSHGVTITLRKAFVEEYKDKVTLTTVMEVYEHHPRPNDVDKDGDIHLAGRDDVIELPLVAEILNGRNESDTMDFLLGTSTGESVDVTGVWRLWFEHPGEDQIQGEAVPIPENSNPDHVFEIHPVTEFGGFNCLDSFLPIVDDQEDPSEEFRGRPATTTFPYYEKRTVTIWRSNTAIMMESKRAYYNYTEFFIKLTNNPKDVGDGYIVQAKVSDSNNFSEPVVESNRRMVFAKGSAPADKVKTLTTGKKMHVLGVPRVNLNELYLIAMDLPVGEAIEVPLPYEMIIVAILKN